MTQPKQPTLNMAYIDEWGEVGKRPKQEVLNVVQNIDGTLSVLPNGLRTDKKGWWFFDGQIFAPPVKHIIKGSK